MKSRRAALTMTAIAVTITLLIYSIEWSQLFVTTLTFWVIFVFVTYGLLGTFTYGYWAWFKPSRLIKSQRLRSRVDPLFRLFVKAFSEQGFVVCMRFITPIVIAGWLSIWGLLFSLILRGLGTTLSMR